MAWPSQQVFVHGGYWQVNVMSNILSCLTLWSLWHISRLSAFTAWHGLVAIVRLYPVSADCRLDQFLFRPGIFAGRFGAYLRNRVAAKRAASASYIYGGRWRSRCSLLASSYIGLGVETAPNLSARPGPVQCPIVSAYGCALIMPSAGTFFGVASAILHLIYNDMGIAAPRYAKLSLD